jgi:alkanesulfonate monooxygenase SsuD/methylene tetrahydromethanopterin reductase-like flavin-dependent oxidoreductase (luciferase family)
MIDQRDVRGLASLTVEEAERAGFDGVMVSEHIVMGEGAAAKGASLNPRKIVMPRIQQPSKPWPNSIVLMSAVGAPHCGSISSD